MSPPSGLGEAFGQGWADARKEAEERLYGDEKPAPDQQKPDPSNFASNDASESASIVASNAEGEGGSVRSQSIAEVAPPPALEQRLRVQFNHRVLADHEKALQKYKRQNNTTMQAIIDQMVEEYLSRRGLLPEAKK